MEDLKGAMAKLNKEQVLEAVQEGIRSGTEPLELIEGLRRGLEHVGAEFEKGTFFLMELMRGAQIFKEAAALIQPVIEERHGASAEKGRVLLGTVAGDVHDLGKGIVTSLLECAGYAVIDLGVDVPQQVFVEKAKEHDPKVVGMSGLLTTSIPVMKQTVQALADAGLRDRMKIIVGGGIVGEVDTAEIGVDYATSNANDGVRVIEDWFGKSE